MNETKNVRFQPKRILVPVDFSDSSHAALKVAIQMAVQYDSEVCLLHVIPMLPNNACDAYVPEERYLRESRDLAEERLTSLMAALMLKAIPGRYSIEIGNDVAGNILFVQKRERADLLIISTHGMTGWRPLVFGTIAEQVMKRSDCPVLLLRSCALAAPVDKHAMDGACMASVA